MAAATQWPTPLKDPSSKLTDSVGRLSTALTNGDMTAAMVSAHDAHEMEHTLSHMGYDWLAAQAGMAPSQLMGMPADEAALAE